VLLDLLCNNAKTLCLHSALIIFKQFLHYFIGFLSKKTLVMNLKCTERYFIFIKLLLNIF
jgi:hypothetical protein